MMVTLENDQGSCLYDRLILRLQQALDQHVQQEHSDEVSVVDLTQGQLALIRAYRNKDVAWLRGWHAAVDEFKVSEGYAQHTLANRDSATAKGIGVCCALCGSALELHAGVPLPACLECGAKIYRAPPVP